MLNKEDNEPTEPWHPEAYCYRREVAYGTTREEAIANVKATALTSRMGDLAKAT